MCIERNEYNNLAGNATGIGGEKSGVDGATAEEALAVMRRSEALVQWMEDAHWEELMGGGAEGLLGLNG
jgi:hypothetical protein